MTALLFHGPASLEQAKQQQKQLGYVASPPLGEAGLKVDQARELVQLVSMPSIGDTVGSVIVGPMDLASPSASDKLLKTLESLEADQVQPLLWAKDLANVRSTVVSRCEQVWCNGSDTAEVPDSVVHLAFDIVKAAIARDVPRVIELLSEGVKDVDIAQLAQQMSMAVSVEMRNPGPQAFRVWYALREILKSTRVYKGDLLLALLEVCE